MLQQIQVVAVVAQEAEILQVLGGLAVRVSLLLN
jgi:hypothetical protein